MRSPHPSADDTEQKYEIAYPDLIPPAKTQTVQSDN
jgi:hypothetical protein